MLLVMLIRLKLDSSIHWKTVLNKLSKIMRHSSCLIIMMENAALFTQVMLTALRALNKVYTTAFMKLYLKDLDNQTLNLKPNLSQNQNRNHLQYVTLVRML